MKRFAYQIIFIFLLSQVVEAEKYSEIDERKTPSLDAAKSIESFQLKEQKYKQLQNSPLKIGFVEYVEKNKIESIPDLLIAGMKDNIIYKSAVTIQLFCSNKDIFFPIYGRFKKTKWSLELAGGKVISGNAQSDNSGFVSFQIKSDTSIANKKIRIEIFGESFKIDASAGPYELFLSNKICYKIQD